MGFINYMLGYKISDLLSTTFKSARLIQFTSSGFVSPLVYLVLFLVVPLLTRICFTSCYLKYTG